MCVIMEENERGHTSHPRSGVCLVWTMGVEDAKEEDNGSRRNQSLFDADLTLLHDGERVSFAKGVQVHGI
jgi:hypothetical protein